MPMSVLPVGELVRLELWAKTQVMAGVSISPWYFLWQAGAPLDAAVSVPVGTRIFFVASPSSVTASLCQQTPESG